MANVAPLGSDILSILIETSCDALDTATLVFSSGDDLLFASRNVQSFYPVDADALRPGKSLRSFLTALFETGVTRGLPGTPAKNLVNEDEWISERIAGMWHERDERTERLGRERWLSVTTRRLPNGLGIMMLRDVSAARKMEERWRHDMERVSVTEDILDNLPAPLFVLDRNLAYVAVNKAYCKLHGITADSILGRNVWDLLDPALAELYENEARAVLETGLAVAQPEEVVTAERGLVRVVKHRFRIGAPGQYLVVTMLQNIAQADAGTEGMDHVVDLTPKRPADYGRGQDLDAGTDIAHKGDQLPISTGGQVIGRALVITSDDGFGDALVLALTSFHFDAYRVASADEAKDLLAMAGDLDLGVDVVLADDMDVAGRLSTIAQMSVSRRRPVHFAVAEAAAALSRKVTQPEEKADATPGAGTDYLPDFQDLDGEAEVVFGVELLVAEDNPINQEVYAQILGGLDISYQLARDGAEAVQMWETLRPPLLFMDISLPFFDGLQATRRIREMERGQATSTYIVGVLPRNSQQDIANCLQAGMNDTIIKPLNVETIEVLYRRHVLASISSDTTRAAI